MCTGNPVSLRCSAYRKNILPSAWQSFATLLAELCHADGKTLPIGWQNILSLADNEYLRDICTICNRIVRNCIGSVRYRTVAASLRMFIYLVFSVL